MKSEARRALAHVVGNMFRAYTWGGRSSLPNTTTVSVTKPIGLHVPASGPKCPMQAPHTSSLLGGWHRRSNAHMPVDTPWSPPSAPSRSLRSGKPSALEEGMKPTEAVEGKMAELEAALGDLQKQHESKVPALEDALAGLQQQQQQRTLGTARVTAALDAEAAKPIETETEFFIDTVSDIAAAAPPSMPADATLPSSSAVALQAESADAALSTQSQAGGSEVVSTGSSMPVLTARRLPTTKMTVRWREIETKWEGIEGKWAAIDSHWKAVEDGWPLIEQRCFASSSNLALNQICKLRRERKNE